MMEGVDEPLSYVHSLPSDCSQKAEREIKQRRKIRELENRKARDEAITLTGTHNKLYFREFWHRYQSDQMTGTYCCKLFLWQWPNMASAEPKKQEVPSLGHLGFLLVAQSCILPTFLPLSYG